MGYPLFGFCLGTLVFLLIPQVQAQEPKTLPLGTIPPRPPTAITGVQFAEQTRGMGGGQRQERALAELRRGNVPAFLRGFKPVELTHARPGKDTLKAVIWVAPDYLAIGADENFLRMPLTYPSAVAIADAFGCVLPTRRMVEAIYQQAAVKLEPQPLPPGPEMRSSEYYLKHRQMIEQQREGQLLGELTAGHKKDVVLTGRLHQQQGRIAIYGWQRLGGRPIQPLSLVHAADYADYSHGIRLVSQTMWVDGEAWPVYEVLRDPQRAPLLTYEGKIDRPWSLMSWGD